MLASYGLASLALTPSPVEMLGQDPPLAEQGLTIAKREVASLRDDVAFHWFVKSSRAPFLPAHCGSRFIDNTGAEIIFAHFLYGLGDTQFAGNWCLKFFQGFGPFAWCSGEAGCSVTVKVLGPVEFMVTGPGQVQLEDLMSGYKTKPVLPPNTGQPIMLIAPAGVSYRQVRLTMLSSGICFHGLRCKDAQPMNALWTFDHNVLPPSLT